MTTRRALDVLRDVRARVDVPLVPMTYAAPVMAYGERRFCADAAAAGADGLIVPDVPADEAGELLAGCREHGLDLVPLLAPTSADDRIALACAHAGGFVYLVSVAGDHRRPRAASPTASPAWPRACARTPTCRCWSASASRRRAHAVAALAAGADGVIIGSKAIEVAEAGGPAALAEFIAARCTARLPVARLELANRRSLGFVTCISWWSRTTGRWPGSCASRSSQAATRSTSSATATRALRVARTRAHDALVLDLQLPRLSGIEVCRRLRDDGNAVPIIMLTARGAVADRIEGLDVGADDYLPKPFSLAELQARLRALHRRGKVEPEMLQSGRSSSTRARASCA